MPAKSRDVKKASGYLPAAMFEQLEKRAEKNLNSISREVVHIIAKALQEETQQQEQPNAPATA